MLRLFLRPTRAIWCLICLCWHSGDKGGRKRGGAWCSDDACLQETPWTGQSVRPSAQAPPTELNAPYWMRHASNVAVVSGRSGAMALADTH